MKHRTTVYLSEGVAQSIKKHDLNLSKLIDKFILDNYPIQTSKEELKASQAILMRQLSNIDKALEHFDSDEIEINTYIDKCIMTINNLNSSISYAMNAHNRNHIKISDADIIKRIESRIKD